MHRSWIHLDTTRAKTFYVIAKAAPGIRQRVFRIDSELLQNTQRSATELDPAQGSPVRLGLGNVYYRIARGDITVVYKHTCRKYTATAKYTKMDTDRSQNRIFLLNMSIIWSDFRIRISLTTKREFLMTTLKISPKHKHGGVVSAKTPF